MKLDGKRKNFVGEGDLEHIAKLVEEKDGGPVWSPVMDKSTSNMSYQAWKREPEVLYFRLFRNLSFEYFILLGYL